MSRILEGEEDKSLDCSLGLLRLAALLLHLFLVLLNYRSQSTIIEAFALDQTESKLFSHEFMAMQTLTAIFIMGELLILYVGTNRFRLKPSLVAIAFHLVGCWLYYEGNLTHWHLENIWLIWYGFSLFPLVSEIAVALYTAKG